MNRSVTLSVIAILLGGLAWLALQNRRLGADLSGARQELRAAVPAAQPPVLHGSVRLDSPAQRPPAPVAAAVPLPPDHWSDPAWCAARYADALINIEGKYGRLFQRLGWPPDRLEALKHELAMNELTMTQAALSGPTGKFTEAEAIAQRDELNRLREENQHGLRDMMGETDYAKLDLYQRADTYRQSTGEIANAMRTKGVAVTDDIEETLAENYAEAMRAVPQGPVGDAGAPLTDDQKADLRRQQQQALQTELARKLSGVLTEQQLTAFLASQLEQEGGR